MAKDSDERSLIVYPLNGEDIEVVLGNESVWASRQSISDIFDIDKTKVASHIEQIFLDGELSRENNVWEYSPKANGKPIEYFSLDVVISVGYRVDSKLATKFRVWATGVLTQYIKDGFVINEEFLRSDPKKLNELAAKLRELRANEKNVYASVRECFKLAASDYEPSSDEVKKILCFTAGQIHHAITQMTSSKLILDRADHSAEHMGLQTIKGAIPTKSEVATSKNYLREPLNKPPILA